MTTTETPVSPEREAAEIRKLDAETEAAKAEARLKFAQAEEAEAKAHMQAIAREKAVEDERARINSDAHHHLYQFNTGVDGGSVKKCMEQLRQWDRLDPECKIELIFNSPGGSVIEGMALFDLITRMSLRGGGFHHITIGAQGYAASMGGVLLQAGDHRWIGRQSYILIHEISAGTSGKIGDIKDDVKFYEMIERRTVQIFVERAQGKITRARLVKSMKRTDWWLDSDEALKLGFVDEVR